MKTQKNKNNNPQTTIKCPKCGTIIDFGGIKEMIKHKIDLELDSILDKI